MKRGEESVIRVFSLDLRSKFLIDKWTGLAASKLARPGINTLHKYNRCTIGVLPVQAIASSYFTVHASNNNDKDLLGPATSGVFIRAMPR